MTNNPENFFLQGEDNSDREHVGHLQCYEFPSSSWAVNAIEFHKDFLQIASDIGQFKLNNLKEKEPSAVNSWAMYCLFP